MTYTGADIIAERLAELDLDHVFGIVSIHNMPIFDAIDRLGKTQIINVRHEQGGAHAADGYARATGKIGVMIASTGPGTTNAVTGLYEAQCASSPLLVITGQVPTDFYGQGKFYVHEAENQADMLRTVTRRVESPRTVGQIANAFDAVVSDMSVGCPSSGAIEIPIDLQYAEAMKPPPMQPRLSRSPVDVSAAQVSITRARRRLIIAGSGVVTANAADRLISFAERLNAPVITSHNGRGAIPEDHPLCAGNLYQSGMLYKSIRDADLTIAVGTSFPAGTDGLGAKMPPPGELIHIDIDPASINRTYRSNVAIAADAGDALSALLESLSGIKTNDDAFTKNVIEASVGVRAGMRKRLGPDYSAIMDVIRQYLPRDGLFVRDSTIAAYNFGNQLLPIYGPRTTMYSVSGAIGPGLPLAIGAAIGTGKRALLIAGDGGFMFHAAELATAAQYELPLVVCIFNDGGYGIIRTLQNNRFGRTFNTELGYPDFVMMAKSMGVPGLCVGSVTAFHSAMEGAFGRAGPSVIEIDMRQLAPMDVALMPKKRS